MSDNTTLPPALCKVAEIKDLEADGLQSSTIKGLIGKVVETMGLYSHRGFVSRVVSGILVLASSVFADDRARARLVRRVPWFSKTFRGPHGGCG